MFKQDNKDNRYMEQMPGKVARFSEQAPWTIEEYSNKFSFQVCNLWRLSYKR